MEEASNAFSSLLDHSEVSPSQKFAHEIPKSGPRLYATFSQLMALAHSVNRKNGRIFTRGCKCESCLQRQKRA